MALVANDATLGTRLLLLSLGLLYNLQDPLHGLLLLCIKLLQGLLLLCIELQQSSEGLLRSWVHQPSDTSGDSGARPPRREWTGTGMGRKWAIAKQISAPRMKNPEPRPLPSLSLNFATTALVLPPLRQATNHTVLRL